jgi:hypothetical protein
VASPHVHDVVSSRFLVSSAPDKKRFAAIESDLPSSAVNQYARIGAPHASSQPASGVLVGHAVITLLSQAFALWMSCQADFQILIRPRCNAPRIFLDGLPRTSSLRLQ